MWWLIIEEEEEEEEEEKSNKSNKSNKNRKEQVIVVAAGAMQSRCVRQGGCMATSDYWPYQALHALVCQVPFRRVGSSGELEL
jgi:hypothetical protein